MNMEETRYSCAFANHYFLQILATCNFEINVLHYTVRKERDQELEKILKNVGDWIRFNNYSEHPEVSTQTYDRVLTLSSKGTKSRVT